MHRLVALLALTLALPARAQDYTSTCLPGRDAADAVSFAVDGQGATHVIRLYRFLGGLEYVRVAPSGAQSTIQINPFVSQIADDEVIDTDVALEGTRPWACYLNAARDRFEVARLSGASFVAETVLEGRGMGRWCSVIVEGSTPVVAFGSDDGFLRLATRTAPNRWSVDVIDAPPGLAVGRDVALVRVGGVGYVIAHRTELDQLRVTWQSAGVWRSEVPSGMPAGPTGASPAVIDAGVGALWIVHGGAPADSRSSDAGLFVSRGDPGALTTNALSFEGSGGSVGAVRRGAHLLLATREKQRSALFGDTDALVLWEDAAETPIAVDLARNGANEERHVYRDIDVALDPFGQPVVVTSDQTEIEPGQPDEAFVCIHRRLDSDADGVPDVVETAWGGAVDAADADADGIADFDEILTGTASAATRSMGEPRQYGASACVASGDTYAGAPIYRFAEAGRTGCQFTGFAVEPDALYAIEFAVRVNAGTLAAWPGLGSSNDSALGRTFGFAADGLWHHERLIVPVPADNQGDLRAVFRITDGDAEIAGVRFTRLDPRVVTGGHFEFADLRGWRPYGPVGCTHDPNNGVFEGGASLYCGPGQKQQITGIQLPAGRYILAGAAMVETESVAVRVGDGNSNLDIDRALGLYARSGWQTFARLIDLPHGTDDLRIVLSSAGEARLDSIRLLPAISGAALPGGDVERDAATWINRNAGRCRVAYTDQLEGSAALSCSGLVEARQSRVPVRSGRLYRMTASVDCISGTCRGDVVLNGGARLTGSTIEATDGPVPYERLFRVPDGIESTDLRFWVRGAALIDAVELTPVAPGDSFLTNGGFEGPFALGWRRYGRAGCAVATSDAWEGTAVLRCADQAAQQIGIPALPSTRYRLSWRRRGAGGVSVRVGDRSSNVDAFGGSYFAGAAGDAWITEDRSFTWPANGSDDLRVVVSASGPVDLDDRRLTVMPGDGDLIREGDFDSGSLIGWERYGASHCEGRAEAAFNGAAGARCEAGGMQQTGLPLAAGRTYRLRYAWRVDSGALQIRIGLGTSNVDFEDAALVSGATDAWAQADRTFTVPVDYAGDARLVVQSSGIARVDAVRLFEVE